MQKTPYLDIIDRYCTSVKNLLNTFDRLIKLAEVFHKYTQILSAVWKIY